jgi:hypothetical protein
MRKPLHAAVGAAAAFIIGLSLVPVAEQPALAQTAGPPPPCGPLVHEVVECPVEGMVPGTEISPFGDDLVARIPASNVVVDLSTASTGPIQVAIQDVAAPVTVQVAGASGDLTAFDAQGQQLSVVEVSPGVFQIS